MIHENPYSTLIELMRGEGAKHNPPSILLGEVVAAEPLAITLEGIQIDRDNLLIADYLLDSYQRQYSENGNIAFSAADCGSTDEANYHSHSLAEVEVVEAPYTGTGTIIFTDSLKQGDLLAVMPTYDRQTFIILARVVSIE